MSELLVELNIGMDLKFVFMTSGYPLALKEMTSVVAHWANFYGKKIKSYRSRNQWLTLFTNTLLN